MSAFDPTRTLEIISNGETGGIMPRAKALAALCAALSFLTLIPGCATPDVAPTYQLSGGQHQGVVYGSVTYSGSFSAYRVHYRLARDVSVEGVFANYYQRYGFIPPRGDFESDDFSGAVFAVPLAAGDYEVFAWTILSGTTTVYSTDDFIGKFRVEPGQLLYLGNFHFAQTRSSGLTVTGAALTYSNAFDRDAPIMRKKFQNLAKVDGMSTVAPATPVKNLGGRSTSAITESLPILMKPGFVPFVIVPSPKN
jgi:hypothetical protein